MSADGGSLYFFAEGQTRKMWLLDMRTGERRVWKELRGVEPPTQLISLLVTPDGASYAYGTVRALSTGYVIEGLR